MAKPKPINLYDDKKMYELKENFDGIGYSNHFPSFFELYCNKAIQEGATLEEAKQSLTESIIRTKPSLSAKKVTKILQENYGAAYHAPSSERLAAMKERRERAVGIFINRVSESHNDDKAILQVNRQSRTLLRVIPELTTEQIIRAYENRESSDEFANIVRDAFSRAFSDENYKLLTEQMDDEAFLHSYNRMQDIGEFAAECEALAGMAANYLTAEEQDRFRSLSKKFTTVGGGIRARMASLVDPYSTVIDFEQVNLMSPSVFTEAEKQGKNDNSICDRIAEAIAGKAGDMESAGVQFMRSYFSSSTLKIIGVLDDKLAASFGNSYGETIRTYGFYKLDGTQLADVFQAHAHVYDTGDMIYMQKLDGSGEKIPVALTDKQTGTYAIGDEVEMPKMPKAPNAPEYVGEPDLPGFFDRFFSAIKKFFTGSPTETMRQYEAEKQRYDAYQRESENYQIESEKYQHRKSEYYMLRALINPTERRQNSERVAEISDEDIKNSLLHFYCLSGASVDNGIAEALPKILAGAVIVSSGENLNGLKLHNMSLEIQESDAYQEMAKDMAQWKKVLLANFDRENPRSCLKAADRLGSIYKQYAQELKQPANAAEPAQQRVNSKSRNKGVVNTI